ncbi:ABC transporter substrate-binding protein [Erythrobacter sp. HL-111]|uniref:ABC transporter substrate-binding protein n=1 Tax=Erythrobacter sp. HL-111 TaxID=1798193 RepID=UPI0006DA0717|nr:ABC transporter substrate-binding protein [Erythrobacter sp. HL-111]KPP94088.1 MAG: ABC-type peptide/nickel uptake system substrate-binding component DppA [Erythrobacteraceae bacterium HL-111]
MLTPREMRFLACLLVAILAVSCGPSRDGSPIDVAIIGDAEGLFAEGVRLSPAAQHLRAATAEGLVALDPAGQVIPAIAERWIVTDDGMSYIFRLRDSAWPDGDTITAAGVRRLLLARLEQLEGTSLGLDLAKITDVRAMTGRVIELRLSSPMPQFLRLLAQPELGLVRSGSGAGPMIMSRDEEEQALVRLSALPPEDRGLPARENWEEYARPLTLRAMPAEAAVDAFSTGEVDLVLNGKLATFPLAELGPLSRGTIRVDPALGLFGLLVVSDAGLLAEPERREALSMAIDRATLIEPFGLGGWQPTEWIAPPGLFDPPAPFPSSRWPDLQFEQRRLIAAARIAAWSAETGEEPVLRVELPPGPGSAILLREIARDWQAIGVRTEPVDPGEEADLVLRDRLARYSSPRWFINQFNCRLDLGLCEPEADELARQALVLDDPAERRRLLVEAHAALVDAEIFIPLGPPVRWSLVRGAVGPYEANQWGLHPLFPLTQPTR